MNPRSVAHYLAPQTILRTPGAKVAHLRAAEQAADAGHKLTWCGQPAPTIFPPWYVIGGESRFAIAKPETK